MIMFKIPTLLAVMLIAHAVHLAESTSYKCTGSYIESGSGRQGLQCSGAGGRCCDNLLTNIYDPNTGTGQAWGPVSQVSRTCFACYSGSRVEM